MVEKEHIRTKSDDSFIVNQLKGIKAIRISLPKPPKFSLIDGYGLPKIQQKFKYVVYPSKLKQLESDVRKTLRLEDNDKRDFVATPQRIIEAIWEAIEKDPEYYEKEIQWIRQQWWHRLFGYWFFNNGIPTYIDGWHYFYLNFWYMGEVKPNHHPEYRDIDRKNFLILRYAYTTHETFKNIHPVTGEAIPDEDGNYEMIELPQRTMLGVIFPKYRRGGLSNIGLCSEYCIMTLSKGTVIGGNQSYTKDQIKKVWNILMDAWEHMPFFFKPMWTGKPRPSELNFVYDKIDNSLGSSITHAETGSETFYEGATLYFKLDEEEGKSVNVKVKYRWNINKNTLTKASGASIQGLSYHVSTVSEAHGGPAQEFKEIFYESDFYKRGSLSGQTTSGLMGALLRANECLEEYIDAWGNGIMGNPTEEQVAAGFNKRHGATQYLQTKRDELRMLNTQESLKQLRIERKEFPMELDDYFFATETSELDFPYEGIQSRLLIIDRAQPPLFERVNFYWTNGERDTTVYYRKETNGRWLLSKALSTEECNKKHKERIFNKQTHRPEMIWYPDYKNRYVSGADPYQSYKGTEQDLKKNKRLLSDGGIATKEFNGRLICTYSYRLLLFSSENHIDETYCEDVIKQIVYFGSPIFPENNYMGLNDYIEARGYSGYLIHESDDNGNFKSKGGGNSNDNTKEGLFNYNKNYTIEHAHEECHPDFLEEMNTIKSKDDMRNHDLFTAVAYANKGNYILSQRMRIQLPSNNSIGRSRVFQRIRR
jgi:hypothetical protein